MFIAFNYADPCLNPQLVEVRFLNGSALCFTFTTSPSQLVVWSILSASGNLDWEAGLHFLAGLPDEEENRL